MARIALNPKQQEIVNRAVDWYYNSPEQVFQFAGNPGTGKSVVMNAIINAIGLPEESVAPMAYIGAAAINMRLKGMKNAKTIHSWIYETDEERVKDEDGKVVMNKYFNRPETRTVFRPKKLQNIKLIAIDEAGTVPLRMKPDILATGVKILAAGDLDQLPPVSDTPAFLTSGTIYVLDEIMRQSKNSAIVYLCQRAKNGLPIHAGVYGNEVIVLEEHDFAPLARILLPKAGVVLCGKNDTREKYTNIIRHDILGKNSNIPDMGEKLICRRNNWNISAGGINLTNGLTGTVINKPDVSRFDGKNFSIDFLPGLTDTPFMNIPVDFEYFTANNERRKEMKKFNYCSGEAFEFGYVQTVHLAQGAQWPTGIYFEEFLPNNNNQLHYTALSRFSRKCIYIKRDRKIFPMTRY